MPQDYTYKVPRKDKPYLLGTFGIVRFPDEELWYRDKTTSYVDCGDETIYTAEILRDENGNPVVYQPPDPCTHCGR
jgi:hypothetical protein